MTSEEHKKGREILEKLEFKQACGFPVWNGELLELFGAVLILLLKEYCNQGLKNE